MKKMGVSNVGLKDNAKLVLNLFRAFKVKEFVMTARLARMLET